MRFSFCIYSIPEPKPQIPQINQKRLTARWIKENGKLICQWIEESDRLKLVVNNYLQQQQT